MRIISGWLGICCTVLGILSIIFYSDIPNEVHILEIRGYILLTVIGIILMYIGRKYLLAWFGVMSSDNDD